jgi:hypothetical protein
VEKLVFLAELTQLTKVMDAACAQVGCCGHSACRSFDYSKVLLPLQLMITARV